MEWTTLVLGFLLGIIPGLLISRHALIVAVKGMSEEKALNRAREILGELLENPNGR